MAKKIISTVLAIVIALSASITVLAASDSKIPEINEFVSAIKSDVNSFKGSVKTLKVLAKDLREELTPYMMEVVLTTENIETVMGLMAKLVNRVQSKTHKHSFTIENPCEEAVRTAATCVADGTYYKSCECGAISSSKNDVFTLVGSKETAPHTLTIYKSNAQEFWNVCVLCGYETEHYPLIKPDEVWTTDEGAHWHLDENNQRVDIGGHIYEEWNREIVDENHEKITSTCTVCGYKYEKTRYICNGNHDYQPIVDKQFLRVAAKNHTDAIYCYSCSRCGEADLTQTFSAHEFINHSDEKEYWSVCKYCEYETEHSALIKPDDEWKSNAKNHWHMDEGTKVDVGVHIPSDWIIDSEATSESNGSMHKECTVCKRVLETQEVTATVSELTQILSKYIFVKVDDVDSATMAVLNGDGTVDENGNGNGVEYKLVTLDDGSQTVYIAVNIVDHPELFNYEVFRNVVDNLYEEQGEALILGEDGQPDYLMSYEHIAGELAFHAIIYAMLNEVIDYTGTTNSTIVKLYLSAAVADLNIDEARVPSSLLSIMGVLLVDMLQFKVLKLFGKL